MRHGSKTKKFNRSRKVRAGLMKSLVVALVDQRSIKTTEAKAKVLRPMIEKIVTQAKKNNIGAKRVIEAKLGSKKMAEKIVTEFGKKFEGRNGGYTRIIKLPKRLKDAASMARIEFID